MYQAGLVLRLKKETTEHNICYFLRENLSDLERKIEQISLRTSRIQENILLEYHHTINSSDDLRTIQFLEDHGLVTK